MFLFMEIYTENGEFDQQIPNKVKALGGQIRPTEHSFRGIVLTCV
jgi:hypothetical protein